MMPAWNERHLGIKLATIHPANPARRLPAVHATYVLKDRATGADLVQMDGAELTRLRTAAASALASSFLSRRDSHTLLMVGAGALAAPLVRYHASVRPIDRVLIWNRSEERARQLASSLSLPAEVISDLSEGVSVADIISCATLSTEALVRGKDVSAGTHIDLVGAYRPDMRESDAGLVRRSRVFVDTYEGARHEAGDLLLAVQESDWSMDHIEADLAVLCRTELPARNDHAEITLFKSVGASLEDLAAASLAWDRFSARSY